MSANTFPGSLGPPQAGVPATPSGRGPEGQTQNPPGVQDTLMIEKGRAFMTIGEQTMAAGMGQPVDTVATLQARKILLQIFQEEARVNREAQQQPSDGGIDTAPRTGAPRSAGGVRFEPGTPGLR